MANVTWSMNDEDWSNIIKETGQGKFYIYLCPAPDEDHVSAFCPGIGVFSKSGSALVDGIPLKNRYPGNLVKKTEYARVFTAAKLSTLFPANITENISLMIRFPVAEVKFMTTAQTQWESSWVAP